VTHINAQFTLLEHIMAHLGKVLSRGKALVLLFCIDPDLQFAEEGAGIEEACNSDWKLG